jgi:hypothetical protein
MTILSKEIDKYKSAKHKKKIITEYIVYLMIDNIPIEAYIEFGSNNMHNRINIIKNNNPEAEITKFYLI